MQMQAVVDENLSSVVCLSFFFIIVVSDKRGAVGAQVGGAARVGWFRHQSIFLPERLGCMFYQT